MKKIRDHLAAFGNLRDLNVTAELLDARLVKSVGRYEKRALIQDVYNSPTQPQRRSAKRKADALEIDLVRRLRACRSCARSATIA